MEGYVQYRREDAYAVLDGNQLMLYRAYSKKLGTPVDIRAVAHLRNGTVSKVVGRRGVKHGLDLVSERGVSTLIDLVDPNVCGSWYGACVKAKNLHLEQAAESSVPEKARAQLGFEPGAKLTKSAISRAYKKLSLKAHPDKGGNPDEFNKIATAYTTLLALQEVADEREETRVLDFEAIVVKQAGVGIGINVVEDKLRKQVIVQSVNDDVLVTAITAEAEEGIRAGDALVSIDSDDCSLWPLSRIRTRLSNLRVPVGASVHFTFERRVPLDWELPSEQELEERAAAAAAAKAAAAAAAAAAASFTPAFAPEPEPEPEPESAQAPKPEPEPEPAPAPAPSQAPAASAPAPASVKFASPSHGQTNSSGSGSGSNEPSAEDKAQSPPSSTGRRSSASAPSAETKTGPEVNSSRSRSPSPSRPSASPAPPAAPAQPYARRGSAPSVFAQTFPSPQAQAQAQGQALASPQANHRQSPTAQAHARSPSAQTQAQASSPNRVEGWTDSVSQRLHQLQSEALSLQARLDAKTSREDALLSELQQLQSRVELMESTNSLMREAGYGGRYDGDDDPSASASFLHARLLQTQDVLAATHAERRALASHVSALRYSLGLAEVEAVQRLHRGNGVAVAGQRRADVYKEREERARALERQLLGVLGQQ